MGRKVFISILGTGPYSECKYVKDNFACESRYIQVATLKYLDEKLKSENNGFSKDNDVAIFFLTEKSETDQWKIGKTKDENRIVEKSGLKDELEKLKLDLNIKHCYIADGKTEEEIWEIFNTIYKEFYDEDELYFDITHAFRYLPMLLLTLINYSKFLKRVSLKSITYGNFMVEGDKPIMDLTAISSLQDWSYASASFIKNGNISELQRLVEKEETDEDVRNIVNFLSNVVRERQTCRGLSIHYSENVKVLKEKLKVFLSDENIKYLSKDKLPLKDIFEKVDESLLQFGSKDNYMNGFYAAKWCCDNGLYQQAITMLRESFVTFLCVKYDYDIKCERDRFCVETALNITADRIKENKWSYGKYKEDDVKDKILKITKDSLLSPIERDGKRHSSDFVSLYKKIRDIRNTFNHNGMSEKNPSFSEIINNYYCPLN